MDLITKEDPFPNETCKSSYSPNKQIKTTALPPKKPQKQKPNKHKPTALFLLPDEDIARKCSEQAKKEIPNKSMS